MLDQELRSNGMLDSNMLLEWPFNSHCFLQSRVTCVLLQIVYVAEALLYHSCKTCNVLEHSTVSRKLLELFT